MDGNQIDPKTYIDYRKKEGSKVHSSITEGVTSSGLTSTRVGPMTDNKLRQLSDDELRKEYFHLVRSRQRKGRVTLLTNKGPLALEIQADKVPKTAENFLELCENGYYKGTKFHRLIKNFMVSERDLDVIIGIGTRR